MGGGVHRLKTGVGQKRQAIGGLKGFAGRFQSGVDIPVPARRTAGLLQRRIERPGDAGIVHCQCCRPPFDGDPLRRPARLPVTVRDHADARIDGDDLAHAGQRLRGRGVEALQPSVELRRAQHHRRQQAGQCHVDAKPRLAGDLLQVVHARRGLADVAVLGRRLARRFLGHRQGGGQGRQFAISERLPGRAQHLADSRAASGRFDLPGTRRGGHQHGAGAGRRVRQGIPGHADAGAAAGAHHAHGQVIGRVFVGHGQAHGGQIHVQLVGQDGGKAAVRALPHFGFVQRERDRAVGRYVNKRIGSERGFGCRPGCPRQGQAQGQAQPAGQAGAAGQKRAATQGDHVRPAPSPIPQHVSRPGGCAGRCRSGTGCRAARRRWRHRPDRACAPAAPSRP